eukprot:2975783-Rhodomonas_salina.1
MMTGLGHPSRVSSQVSDIYLTNLRNRSGFHAAQICRVALTSLSHRYCITLTFLSRRWRATAAPTTRNPCAGSSLSRSLHTSPRYQLAG